MINTKEIKKILCKEYPNKKISVRKDHGWVNVTILKSEFFADVDYYSQDGRKLSIEISDHIDRVLMARKEELGVTTFTSDSGYDYELSRININYN